MRKMKAFGFSVKFPSVIYWRLPAENRKTERLVVQHLEKAGRSAAMLDVGLAVGAGCSEEDACLASDEFGQIRTYARLPRPALFHARIALSRTLTALDRLDGGSEGDIAGIRD